MKGVNKYHTKRKKAFLFRLAGLHTKEGLSRCWFRVDYLPGAVNESIRYTDPKKALLDARRFTAKVEIDFIQKYWRGV